VVVYTIGSCGPEAVEFLVPGGANGLARIPLHFHGNNDFGRAIGLRGCVRPRVSGMDSRVTIMHGERAGNADIGEVSWHGPDLQRWPDMLDLTRFGKSQH